MDETKLQNIREFLNSLMHEADKRPDEFTTREFSLANHLAMSTAKYVLNRAETCGLLTSRKATQIRYWSLAEGREEEWKQWQTHTDNPRPKM